MRGPALLVAAGCALAGAGARADGLRALATGFDHTLHARDLDVNGVGPVACATCHLERQGLLVGRPGHAACFGACHGTPPIRPRRGGRVAFGERAAVCESCHPATTQATPFSGSIAVSYPPYSFDRDFNVAFGHRAHAAVPCSPCHDMRPQAPARPPHARCAGCHDGGQQPGHGPAMSACTGCHPRAVGVPQPPALAPVVDSVTASFSHPRHAGRGAAGARCESCHATIASTDDSALPRPTMQSCGAAACHDGTAAFAVTEACTRCHDRAPTRGYLVARPQARFRHDGDHADVVSRQPCVRCHAVGPRGDTQVASHAACAGCHAADFSARTPRTCGACHDASEPWRPLVADRAPSPTSEFGAWLDHARHPQACTSCHSLRTASSQLRPPRGHVACTGSGCHARAGGPAPAMEACDGCHRRGLTVDRTVARLSRPWSVRASFDHQVHAIARDGAAVPCTSCHASPLVGDVLELPGPQKATCAPCHDGRTAFKLTGDCTRCHRGAAP